MSVMDKLINAMKINDDPYDDEPDDDYYDLLPARYGGERLRSRKNRLPPGLSADPWGIPEWKYVF